MVRFQCDGKIMIRKTNLLNIKTTSLHKITYKIQKVHIMIMIQVSLVEFKKKKI